jgi:multiple sugar transport system ATP-binding protein
MMNLLDANIKNGSFVVGQKDMVCTIPPEQLSRLENYQRDRVVVGIRPEDIEITREKHDVNSFQCTIYFMQSMGAEDILNLKRGKTEFRAIAPPRLMTKIGETVYTNLNLSRAHIFDPETEKRLN